MLLPLAAIELIVSGPPTLSFGAAAGVLYLGLVASGLAYLIYNIALRSLDAGIVGVFVNVDPIAGVVIAMVVTHEGMSLIQVIGAVIAMAGMWLASSTNE